MALAPLITDGLFVLMSALAVGQLSGLDVALGILSLLGAFWNLFLTNLEIFCIDLKMKTQYFGVILATIAASKPDLNK